MSLIKFKQVIQSGHPHHQREGIRTYQVEINNISHLYSNKNLFYIKMKDDTQCIELSETELISIREQIKKHKIKEILITLASNNPIESVDKLLEKAKEIYELSL